MTYNKREIMTNAWIAYKAYQTRGFSNSFASCLRHAWYQARCKVAQANAKPMTKRQQLETQILILENSDALGATAKLKAAERELAALPAAA